MAEDFFRPSFFSSLEGGVSCKRPPALFGSSRILAPLLVCCPEAGHFFLRKSAGGGVNKAHAFSFSQFGGKRRKPEKTSLHCLALSPDERPVSGVFSGSGVILFAKKEREQG